MRVPGRAEVVELSVAKKVALWILVAIVGLYLVFRAVTPFWVDMTFIITGVVVVAFSILQKKDDGGK